MDYPVVFVIFGATGDLAERKLFPALFWLYCHGLLPTRFKIVAFARRPFTDQSFRELVRPVLDEDKAEFFDTFLDKIVYHQGLFEEQKPYIALINRLGEIDKELGACSHKIFHLALSPFFYDTVLAGMEASGLNLSCTDGTGETRVLIEKPIGSDLVSARKINTLLADIFREEQIFRVDHYLAKNALNDLLTVRFVQSAFGQSIASAWNSGTIERLDISLYEKITAAGRGAFYDKIGAVRDVGQNHLLEMLALLLIEKESTDADRDKRLYHARALSMLDKADIGADRQTDLKRAQYEGYLAEEGVTANSPTETYFQIPFSFREGIWKGVLFTLAGGKGLAQAEVAVSVIFRRPVNVVFGADRYEISKLTLVVQPSPSIEMLLMSGIKKTIPYESLFPTESPSVRSALSKAKKSEKPDNYQTVYLDVLHGDHSRFVSKNEVEACWTFVDRALAALSKTPLLHYPVGTEPEKIV